MLKISYNTYKSKNKYIKELYYYIPVWNQDEIVTKLKILNNLVLEIAYALLARNCKI